MQIQQVKQLLAQAELDATTATGLLKVEFSLIRLSAEGEGKLVSLLPEATTLLPASLLPLPADRPELNPLELEVRFPRPFSLYCWYRLGAGS